MRRLKAVKLREATLLQFVFAQALALSLWNLVVTTSTVILHATFGEYRPEWYVYDPQAIGILLAVIFSSLALRWATNSSEPN